MVRLSEGSISAELDGIEKSIPVVYLELYTPPSNDTTTQTPTVSTEATSSPSDDDIYVPGDIKNETICGQSSLTATQLSAFIEKNNSTFDIKIAEAFIKIGEIYGIRGDVACCQSIIETGWFKFADGTAVKSSQHNYCGLGVTSLGETGCAFSSIEDGVEAQIQHLYAYAVTAKIPTNRKLLDPRFRYVTRGVATRWVDLNGRWSMSGEYGETIMKMYINALTD